MPRKRKSALLLAVQCLLLAHTAWAISKAKLEQQKVPSSPEQALNPPTYTLGDKQVHVKLKLNKAVVVLIAD